MPVCGSVSEERQLDLDEKPLVVQLNWNKDDREGRFVLKNENDILPKVSHFKLEKVKQKNQKSLSYLPGISFPHHVSCKVNRLLQLADVLSNEIGTIRLSTAPSSFCLPLPLAEESE